MEQSIRETELYARLLTLRPTIKAIQQISWEISNLEKKYPINLLSGEELADVIGIYEGLIKRAKETIL